MLWNNVQVVVRNSLSARLPVILIEQETIRVEGPNDGLPDSSRGTGDALSFPICQVEKRRSVSSRDHDNLALLELQSVDAGNGEVILFNDIVLVAGLDPIAKETRFDRGKRERDINHAPNL